MSEEKKSEVTEEVKEARKLSMEELEQVTGGGSVDDKPNCKYYKQVKAYKSCPSGFMGRTQQCDACILNEFNN